jgi:hypothetical protein
MTDRPDGKRRFWATSLPWKMLFLLVYFALSILILVMFWNAGPLWTSWLGWPLWGLNLAAIALTWITFIRMVVRDIKSLRLPSDQID